MSHSSVKEEPLTAHLVGHKVRNPGTPGDKSAFNFSNKESLFGDKLASFEISNVVSRASFMTLDVLIVSDTAKFNACP